MWWDGGSEAVLRVNPTNGVGLAQELRIDSWSYDVILWKGWDEMAGQFLKKAAATKAAKNAAEAFGLNDKGFSEEYPAIAEFLSLTELDGQKRDTSTLLIVFEDGLFKMMINDRDNQQTLWISAEIFEELLPTLELTLTSEPVRWRPARQYNGQPSKGGKR